MELPDLPDFPEGPPSKAKVVKLPVETKAPRPGGGISKLVLFSIAAAAAWAGVYALRMGTSITFHITGILCFVTAALLIAAIAIIDRLRAIEQAIRDLKDAGSRPTNPVSRL